MVEVGSIYTVRYRYFDIRSNRYRFKSRPFLIVKLENSHFPKDLTALPVSKITDRSRRDAYYDIEIKKQDFPKLNLNETVSFLRIAKVTTISEMDLINKVSDPIYSLYPNLYDEIKRKFTQYYNLMN